MFGVIFDVDGVLIDSVATAYRVRSRLLAAHGVSLAQVPDPHHEGHKGGSLKQFLTVIEQHFDIELDRPAFARATLEGVLNELRDTRADPDLISLLQDLKRRSVPCAIASSGRSEGVRGKLEILGIRDYFEAIVTADDAARHKPNPEPYLLAAERLGLDSRHCIAIEDSAAGIAAARAAGCSVIGFTRFSDDKRPLEGAELTVDSWSELSYERLDWQLRALLF